MNRNRNRIVTVVVSLALAAVILLLSRSGISPGGERLEVLKTTIPCYLRYITQRLSVRPQRQHFKPCLDFLILIRTTGRFNLSSLFCCECVFFHFASPHSLYHRYADISTFYCILV